MTAGRRGEPGAEGRPGRPGDEGQRGLVGKQGAQGAAGPNTTKRLLVMFIFVVMIFIIISLRVQANTRQIDDASRRDAVARCEGGAAILTRFNMFLNNMADVEQAGIDSGISPNTVATRRDRIKIYHATVIEIPDCSKAWNQTRGSKP